MIGGEGGGADRRPWLEKLSVKTVIAASFLHRMETRFQRTVTVRKEKKTSLNSYSFQSRDLPGDPEQRSEMG